YTQRFESLKENPTLNINGESIAALPADSYTWCYVKAGRHVVRALWPDRYAGVNIHLKLEFAAGDRVFLRLITRGDQIPGIVKNVFGQIDPVAEGTARYGVENATYRKPRKE